MNYMFYLFIMCIVNSLTRMLAPQRQKLPVWFIAVYPVPRSVPGTNLALRYLLNECIHENMSDSDLE